MKLQRIVRRLRARSARAARAREGGFSILEAVIAIPTALILTMIAVQFVMLWHARHVAEAAARDGLRVARGYQHTSAQGQSAACAHLDKVAAHMLTQRSCTATRSATDVVVSVHAKVMSVIPFGSFSVDQSVSGPVEKFNGGR